MLDKLLGAANSLLTSNAMFIRFIVLVLFMWAIFGRDGLGVAVATVWARFFGVPEVAS